jgi:hypothetical protein
MTLQPSSSNANSVHRVITIKGLHTTNVDVIVLRFIELFHSIRTAKKDGLLCGLRGPIYRDWFHSDRRCKRVKTPGLLAVIALNQSTNEIALEGLVLLGLGGHVTLPTMYCDSPRSLFVCPPPVL